MNETEARETMARRLAEDPPGALEFSGVDEFSLTADAEAGLREFRRHLTEPSGGAREAQEAREPLLDPDCRDGKHGSCVGPPCECTCHQETP